MPVYKAREQNESYQRFLLRLMKGIMLCVLVVTGFIALLDILANILGANIGNSWVSLIVAVLFIALAVLIRRIANWRLNTLDVNSKQR